jgi:hypothetical protein
MASVSANRSGVSPKWELPPWMRVVLKGREGDPWWHPRRLMLKIVGTAAAVVATQFVVPSAIPYLELWTYQYTGYSLSESRFLVATTNEGTPSDSEPEYYQVFCGLKHRAVQYCVMRSLLTASGVRVGAWEIDPNTHTKAVLLGEGQPGIELSWISQYSGKGGSATAQGVLDPGTYIGSGFACASPARGESGRPMRIRVLFSYLSNLQRNTDLDTINTAVMAQLGSSTVAETRLPSHTTCG